MFKIREFTLVVRWFFICLISLVLAEKAFAVDFNREPDATINTNSLFDLPKDIVSAPVLKDLLTEDFVFYYRDSGADWLSFKGTLARLAFEQQLDWPTKLASWILNGPAEIALWKSDDGKLSQFMIIVEQTGVKDLAGILAKSTLLDQQLHTQDVAGVKVTTLSLSTGRKVYLAAEGGRVFIYSDAAMTVPLEALRRSFSEKAKAFFGLGKDVSVFSPKLEKSKHIVTLSTKYISFGYQAFFPDLKVLKFDFNRSGEWQTEILINKNLQAADSANWSKMPKGAAFCFSLPIDLNKIASIIKANKVVKKIKNSVISCWYSDSKFYTPVMSVSGDFSDLLKNPNEFKTIFSNTVGVREAIWSPGESEELPSKLSYLPMLPVQVAKLPEGKIGYIREVGGRFGLHNSDKSSFSKKLGSRHFFRVKAVMTSNSLIFSPDDRLVDKVLTTLAGQFPSMASSINKVEKNPLFVFSPADVSKLAKSSILDSLPQSQEFIFRTAVSRHLFPNLDKFAKQPTYSASLSGNGEWKKVEWTRADK